MTVANKVNPRGYEWVNRREERLKESICLLVAVLLQVIRFVSVSFRQIGKQSDQPRPDDAPPIEARPLRCRPIIVVCDDDDDDDDAPLVPPAASIQRSDAVSALSSRSSAEPAQGCALHVAASSASKHGTRGSHNVIDDEDEVVVDADAADALVASPPAPSTAEPGLGNDSDDEPLSNRLLTPRRTRTRLFQGGAPASALKGTVKRQPAGTSPDSFSPLSSRRTSSRLSLLSERRSRVVRQKIDELKAHGKRLQLEESDDDVEEQGGGDASEADKVDEDVDVYGYDAENGKAATGAAVTCSSRTAIRIESPLSKHHRPARSRRASVDFVETRPRRYGGRLTVCRGCDAKSPSPFVSSHIFPLLFSLLPFPFFVLLLLCSFFTPSILSAQQTGNF